VSAEEGVLRRCDGVDGGVHGYFTFRPHSGHALMGNASLN
jgi:hypothetical protein